MGNTRFILALIMAVVAVAPRVSLSMNISTDQLALLALKANILNNNNTSPNLLATNWSTTTSVCNWIGVACSSSHLRVSALNLSNFNLFGTIPPHLGNLSFLATLDLGNNAFHGSLPPELAQLRRLKSISLSNNNFNGEIPSWLGSLPNLQTLSLNGNNFNGLIPLSLTSLSKLERMSLYNNSLQGQIPEAIGNLSRLKWLRLNDNQLSGPIPSSLFNISSLLEITASDNQLSGSLPSIPILINMSSPLQLQVIDFTYNNLTGPIPTNMFDGLPKLRGLYLSANQFSGPIPIGLFKCQELEDLSLSRNYFEGPIPEEIRNLTGLRRLYLGVNPLEGEIPEQIGSLLNLADISLPGCNLRGPIPSVIGNLSRLTLIDFSENNLTGNIPYQIGNLPILDGLYLTNNHITEAIPPSIFNSSSLRLIVLTANQLSGNLPSTLGLHLPKLQYLELGMNGLISGPIPSSIGNASQLIRIDLGNNMFSGYVPDEFGNLRNLQLLNIQGNNLSTMSSTSELSFLSSLTNCKDLGFLAFSMNPLISGKLPISIGNLSVEELVANECNIKGSIPSEIGNLSNLIHLDLDSNQLVGTIPTAMGRLRKLQKLTLQANRLEGSIPTELCQLKSLSFLYLTDNNLVGSIPTCFGDLISLRDLFLDSNKISGSIPSNLTKLIGLLQLNLASNSINGTLPIGIEKLKAVNSIDLLVNQLSGEIPEAIGDLLDLTYLSLSSNKLQGSIPESFGDLKGLQYLDLSRNNLSGAIPKSLEELSSLGYFNVSFNRLQGEISSKGPFNNYSIGSFIGNEGLCALPRLQLPLPPCKVDSRRQHSSKARKLVKYILLPVGSTILVLALILVFLQRRKRNAKHRIDEENSKELVEWRRVPYHELRQATNGFSESNLIGMGSFGSVYQGTLLDGMNIAVKVFNLELEGGFKSFDVECEVLRNIRHRNLVKIISSCSNNLDFKALVLEFMPSGSLEKWLYFDNHFLDITQRLNIVIDVASALEYLHHGCTPSVVHCDLKPSNVLLDEDMVARLGDFSIAKLMGEEDSTIHTMTLATIGYMAPEYGSEGNVSTKGDVYSFGILLMETFTRKKPTDEMFSEELSLRDWVAKSTHSPSALVEVVDTNLVDKMGGHVARMDCALSVLKLALECSKELAEERIDMKQAVAKLKNIKTKLLKDLGERA